jgi:hypothetical protein
MVSGTFYLVNIAIKRHCHGAEGSGDVVRVPDIATCRALSQAIEITNVYDG